MNYFKFLLLLIFLKFIFPLLKPLPACNYFFEAYFYFYSFLFAPLYRIEERPIYFETKYVSLLDVLLDPLLYLSSYLLRFFIFDVLLEFDFFTFETDFLFFELAAYFIPFATRLKPSWFSLKSYFLSVELNSLDFLLSLLSALFFIFF